MSACLSGGGAAYSFDLEKMKSPPSTSTTTTRATSPSSTLSESSNSPLAISTRKPRTARKRPNQTYNEAAALLSSAYPNIFFSNNNNNKTTHFLTKSPLLSDTDETSELLLSYESIEEPDFLFHQPKPESFFFEHHNKEEVNSGVGGDIKIVESIDFSDEFDAESILDEEIEEGIDSIMGNAESNSGEENLNLQVLESRLPGLLNRTSKGIKFPLGLGLRSSLRENNEASLMRFHTVDFEQISPRIQTTLSESTVDQVQSETKKQMVSEKSKKKKKKKVAALSSAPMPLTESVKEETEERSGPMLKLNYDSVLKAWSDKVSPFSDDLLGSEATGADVNARLAQIDLFGDNGMREASVLRYKEKRRTRLYSKKIRYQVRKLNADQRPRMKGRFVRRSNESSPSGER